VGFFFHFCSMHL